jgi:hypothetical protein
VQVLQVTVDVPENVDWWLHEQTPRLLLENLARYSRVDVTKCMHHSECIKAVKAVEV